MTRSAFLLAGLLGCAGLARAQQVVALENGDRLSGRLLRITDDTWVFRYQGAELELPAATVQGLIAAQPLGLRLADGTIAAATVAAVPGGLQLTLADGTTRVVPPSALAAAGSPDDLAALRPVRIGLFSPFTRFWGATGSVGLSDKSGNSRARGIALSLDGERKTSRDRLSAGAAIHRESSQPAGGQLATTVEKYFGYLRADIYMSPRFFAFGQTQQEHDRFQDVDLRSTYTAGLGWQAVARPRTDVRFWGSSGLRHETFIANGSDQASVAVAGGALSQRLGPATLAWRAEITPSLEDLSDYRLRSDASLTTALFAGIGIRLGAVNEFNNRPRPGVERHDMLLTTTVTYSIGR